MAATQVLLEGLDFGEAPRWHEGRLWFSDFYRGAVYAVDTEGREERIVAVDGQPGGLGWTPHGHMLVVSMVPRRVLRQEYNGDLVSFADLNDLATFHANDMIVDRNGRAFVGNFGYDLHEDLLVRSPQQILADESAGLATLARVEPDGSVHEAARDLRFPNGMVFLDDERTLVVAETLALRLTAFEVEPLGRLKGRRVWASTAGGPNGPVVPDGIAADPQGGIWVANGLGAECVRFAEGGEASAHVETRQLCYACALGGEDGRTLFCMTAPSSLPGEVAGRGLGTIEVAQV